MSTKSTLVVFIFSGVNKIISHSLYSSLSLKKIILLQYKLVGVSFGKTSPFTSLQSSQSKLFFLVLYFILKDSGTTLSFSHDQPTPK